MRIAEFTPKTDPVRGFRFRTPHSAFRIMTDFPTQILHELSRKNYQPVKAKALARKLGVGDAAYPDFRKAVKALVKDGRIELGKNNVLRPADQFGAEIGVYRRTNSGHGFVRPHPVGDAPAGADIYVREGKERDASTGDEVMVRVTRRATATRDAAGEVIRVLHRATRTFVGTYFERDGQAYVRVDGTVFAHSVWVGDPGAKGAKPQDKVVIDMLRFPTAEERGEAVITEVLGPLTQPGVDLLSIVKAFGLPEAFPEEALAEARAQADKFREDDRHGRTDFTGDCVVTIDPADARDFDDAVSVTIDPKTKHWVLTVHIADVAHFAPPGGPLDAEARKRGTSVYLPQKVIPMFPEVISNGLASLQQGKVRYVKTVRMEFTQGLQKGHVQFFNGVIRPRRRFAYEEVQAIFDAADGKADQASGGRKSPVPADVVEGETEQGADAPRSPEPPDAEVLQTLKRMRDLAALLRKKRFRRGSLELTMPEAVLEYDDQGRVSGAHFAANDESHQVIEEFMLAANEAVAEHLTSLGVPFLRRVHPAPKDEKLEQFAQFAALLGYPVNRPEDRFELQRVLRQTADKPERAAIHYSLLRSLKQASYSPVQDEHYALASQHYCHFTSPIRRYPDLQVHRLLDRWIRTGKCSANLDELKVLGDHCSRLERRAETAERELVKLKLLQYLSTRLGEQLDAVITGVADYGFFAQAERFPAEGLIHISSLADDYYHYDEQAHALVGGRGKRRFRLGDRVRVEVARVDVQRRMLDFRLAGDRPPADDDRPRRPTRPDRRPRRR
jgi:ribonuclease R